MPAPHFHYGARRKLEQPEGPRKRSWRHHPRAIDHQAKQGRPCRCRRAVDCRRRAGLGFVKAANRCSEGLARPCALVPAAFG
jgi:hypothetical protein